MSFCANNSAYAYANNACSDWLILAGDLDTQRSLFRESGDFRTYYVRMVRVCYTTSELQAASSLNPTVLTYRSFLPAQLTKGGAFSSPKYETMSETMKRASAWLNATG